MANKTRSRTQSQRRGFRISRRRTKTAGVIGCILCFLRELPEAPPWSLSLSKGRRVPKARSEANRVGERPRSLLPPLEEGGAGGGGGHAQKKL